VNRTLAELELREIPRLLVFNKTDLVERADLTAMQREVQTETGSESLAISAANRATLPLLLDRIEAATRGTSQSAQNFESSLR